MYRKTMLAAGALALATASSTAMADDPRVNMRLSYWVPATHMLTPGYQEWADHLKKESGGTINVTLFPASQLGSGRDHYDMVRRGLADIGLVNPGYTPGRFPIAGAIELPFMISNSLEGAKAMTRFYAQYAPQEMSEVKVCHNFSTPLSTFHAVKPIRVPADVRGMRIRAGNATMSSFISSLGGTSVQVPIMEAFETLNRGITEGITAAWGGMITFNFGKVVRYHLDMPLYVSSFVNAVNINTYNRMSDAQKKIFDATCTPEWAARIYRYWEEQEAGFVTKLLADKDRTIHKVGPEEAALWRKAAEPVMKQWADSVTKRGADPEKVLAHFREELRKDGALYE